MTLDQMQIGAQAQVLALRLKGGQLRRMLDLGLTRGTPIRAIQRSPSGDPVAYYFRGTVIALRAADASKIEVSMN